MQQVLDLVRLDAPLSAPGFSRIVERAAVSARLGIKAHAHMLRLLMVSRAIIGLFLFSLTSSANAETALRSGSALAECITIKYRDTPVCLNTFTCTETPQSSFVREICYDATKSYMLVKLNETWYHYCSVDPASVDNLVHAASVGSYFNNNLRSRGQIHGPFDCRDHAPPSYN
jgi:KTSC domain